MGVRSCLHTAPRSFELDDSGKARGAGLPGDELATILDAAKGCPNFAITVLVDDAIAFDPFKD
jgi:ferredoxin